MADPKSGFVHLHNHTTYSLLDGAQRIDEMCARAAADHQPAIAITDHGNLFGAMSFGKKAAKHGIKPIVGLEAYLAVTDRKKRHPEVVEGVGRKNYYHLVLLAENYVGYKNLIKLASAGYLEGFYYRPRIDKTILAEHSEGLICLSACLAGEVATRLRHGQYEHARNAAGEFRDLFGRDRFWLEMQDHGIEEQTIVNEGVLKLSKELGVDVVATNDCHYLLREDHAAHDVLICIQTGTTVNNRSGMSYTHEHYLKSQAEMRKLFSASPEAVANTLAVAERCRFTFEKQPLHLPEFPVPPGYDLDGYFEKTARNGLEVRLREQPSRLGGEEPRHPHEDYHKRLDREIRIIREMGFSGYFLITWDFIRYARDSGIPVGPGRGSAAGSLAAYCLRITDIDPMQNELLFERFLNPERVSMPDIDIDFCFRKRERVIEYVTEKYGRPNVAQIITFGTMAARAVIRDVGRVLEVPYTDVDRIAKLVPAIPGQDVTIAQALKDVPKLKEAYDKEDLVHEMLDLCQRLEGLTRHASTHAAGVVIAPKPIVEFAPLYRGTKDGDEITTQFAKDEIEEIGLLKLDFLGLKTLTLIADALESVAAATGSRPDMDSLRLDDAKVYELFCRAETDGVFQFESSGMKDILRRLKPERFGDLVALNALYRPGPLGGGLIDDFIKRRQGKVKVRYLHPLLEPILKETYGVIVYQEQVMQIASAMAGYSLGEADILRRAMGKKKKEVMEAEEAKFLAGAEKLKIAASTAKKVFDLMAFFAGYGFNKSHSAAYALVAFQTAWLKAHHPVHFMAALLTTEKGNTDKMVQYIGESRRMGIQVLPPDVSSSGLDFTVEQGQIRFGLSAIKNVGEAAIRSIVSAREGREHWRSLHELCGEIDLRLVNKRVLEALVQSGALDSMGAKRSQLDAAVDSALEYGQRRRLDREAGQASLFGGGADDEDEEPQLPDLPDWDEKTRLNHEKATLGFYVSGHPLEGYRELLDQFASQRIATLDGVESGTEVSVGGVITNLRRRRSKKGDMWASMAIEDLDGQIDVLIFPKAYETCQALLDDDRPTLVSGRYEIDEERKRIIGSAVCPLDQLRERRVDAVQVRLNAEDLSEELVERLLGTVEANRGDARLFLEIARPGSYRLVALAQPSFRVRPSERLNQELETIVGPNRVRYRPKPNA
jgi:DNA polymerase-3 subunit alpha